MKTAVESWEKTQEVRKKNVETLIKEVNELIRENINYGHGDCSTSISIEYCDKVMKEFTDLGYLVVLDETYTDPYQRTLCTFIWDPKIINKRKNNKIINLKKINILKKFLNYF